MMSKLNFVPKKSRRMRNLHFKFSCSRFLATISYHRQYIVLISRTWRCIVCLCANGTNVSVFSKRRELIFAEERLTTMGVCCARWKTKTKEIEYVFFAFTMQFSIWRSPHAIFAIYRRYAHRCRSIFELHRWISLQCTNDHRPLPRPTTSSRHWQRCRCRMRRKFNFSFFTNFQHATKMIYFIGFHSENFFPFHLAASNRKHFRNLWNGLCAARTMAAEEWMKRHLIATFSFIFVQLTNGLARSERLVALHSFGRLVSSEWWWIES